MDRVVGPEYKRLALEGPEEESGAGAAEAGAAAVETKNWTLALPDELLENIFRFLDYQDLGNASVVCRRWYSVLFAQVKREIPVFDPMQPKVLFSISNGLLDIGYTTAAVQVARMIRGIYEKSTALRSICNKLIANAGTRLQAIGLANTIPNRVIKIETLREMHLTLLETGNVDQAREVVATMPEQMAKWEAYVDICKKYLEMENVDQARVVADMIVGKWEKSVALGYVSKKFRDNGDGDTAQKIADTIPDKDRKREVLRELFPAN